MQDHLIPPGEIRDHHREALEAVRQEQERLRQASESASPLKAGLPQQA